MKRLLNSILLLVSIGCSVNYKTEAPKDDTVSTIKQSEFVNTNENGIEFGFADETGKHVMMIKEDTLQAPNKFTRLIASKEEEFRIGFIEKKQPSVDDTGRQTASNFNNTGGYLFEIKQGTVNTDRTVLFLTEDFLSDRVPLILNDVKGDISNSTKQKIESDKGRKIKSYRSLTELDKGRSIHLVEFDVKNDSALASLVLITPNGISYNDYLAIYNEASTWSAEDGGEFGIEYYEVLAVFEKQDVVEIVTDRVGVEGYSIEYIKQDGAKFRTIKTAYRYSAPL